MKIEITYTSSKGVQVTLFEQPKGMDEVEVASVIEEAIQELRNLQLSLMPNNDHT